MKVAAESEKSDKPVHLIDQKYSGKVIIGNMESTGYKIANCCNPIPGDEIIALFSSGKQPFEIHQAKCSKAIETISTYGNNFKRVEWALKAPASFLTGIKLSGIDRMGMISEISRIISADLKINIKSFSMDVHDGLTEGEMMLYMQDTITLKQLLKNLKEVEGIKKVSRIN